MDQNLKNHSRYIPIWHFFAGFLVIAILGGSIVNFINASDSNYYSAALILAIAVILIIFFWYSRAFSLRAQDRAIRAEENFRHYILTGKPFDNKLSMVQIIALRFASDMEMPALAKKTVEENLSSKEIKESIKSWRADHNRA